MMVIDLKTNVVIKEIPGSFTNRLLINETTNKIYVEHSEAPMLLVIDGTNNTIIAEVPLAEKPVGMTIDPSTNLLYTIMRDRNQIDVFHLAEYRQINTLHMMVHPPKESISVHQADTKSN